MPKIDHVELPDEPTMGDLVSLFKRFHDCMEQRFDEAATERAAIAEQVRTDRHASKNRDMVLDGGLDQLRKTIESVGKTQVAMHTQMGTLSRGQKAMAGKVGEAARKSDTAATAAAAVGAKVSEITAALGLTGNKPKPVALWSPTKVLTAVAAAGTTLFFFAKIADALWPFAGDIAKALWKVATN